VLGSEIVNIKLEEEGMAIAPERVVTFDSFITSIRARAISSVPRLVTIPTSIFPYGPRERAPYVSRTAFPPFFFSWTTLIEEEPISIPSALFEDASDLNIFDKLESPEEKIFLSELSIWLILSSIS
jgi:hypothetical protein